ncbi:hypothetical protein CDD83_4286 [Cordyceps sp. RAO-2017]|nr:hypothetical protein CDD83_4286 [Cordyceps sp. RAO-2017]
MSTAARAACAVGAPPPSPENVVAEVGQHTMLQSLFPYVEKKMHQLVKDRPWAQIVVRGSYVRSGGAVAADCEKSDKMFNWHRPTATQLDADTLALNCFPGLAYTEHYAGLVRTYLALSGRDASVVRCVRPRPDQCAALFAQSNLRQMGRADIVLIGYVYQLERVSATDWTGRGDGNLFAWQKTRLDSGLTVAYLECMVSFWGDIAGHLTRALQRYAGLKCLIFIGKAGSLRPDKQPNEWIVSGERSHMGDAVVAWPNVLAPELDGLASVEVGDIATVDSPLCESLDWLRQWQPRCSWVDCEIGHMALASRQAGTDFAYLNLISDNVAGSYNENLANEDASTIRHKRELLFRQVDLILTAFLDRYPGGTEPRA